MTRMKPTPPPHIPALVRRGAAAAAVGLTVTCGGQTSGSEVTPQPSGTDAIDASSTFVAASEAGANTGGADATNADGRDAEADGTSDADVASDSDAGPIFIPPMPPPLPPPPLPPPVSPPK